MVQQSKLVFNDRTFEASTSEEKFTAGQYVHRLILHWKVDNTTATALTVANVLNLIDPFEVKRFGDKIISINGSDMYALNVLMWRNNPFTVVAGSATDEETTIMGMRVPVWQRGRPDGALTWRAVRNPVTNGDTEILSVWEEGYTKTLSEQWLHYNEITFTTVAASTFEEVITLNLTGDLIGLLFFGTTIPTATSQNATVGEVKLEIGGREFNHINWQTMKGMSAMGHHDLMASPADAGILDNYAFWSFTNDPIPAGTQVRISNQNDTGNAEAMRIIPVQLVRG